jgi:hypothetical protein
MLRNLISFSKKWSGEFLWVASLCFASAAYGLWIFRESLSTLFSNSIPLGGDGASTGFFLRLVLESSWGDFFSQHIYSEQFGWPGKIDYTSYPTGQFLELTVIKLIGMVFGPLEPSSIIHFAAVLKIIPITLSGYILLRVLSVPSFLSVIGAIAFSTSTYNLIRAEGHFFLGFTWSVPLAIAALFLSYRFSYQEEFDDSKLKRLRLFQIVLLSLPIGFSNFYYSLVTIILNAFFLGGFWIARSLSSNKMQNIYIGVVFLKKNFVKSLGFIASGLSIAIGLAIQLLPIIYRSSKNPSLSGIADRSPTESIVFSGSLESYFFDFSSAVLKFIERREILNFTSTRISWEGSQLGALTGLFGFTVIVILTSLLLASLWTGELLKNKEYLKSIVNDKRVIFFLVLILVLFFLYLPNPVNFGISQILPQLRAWGRVSVFLTMSSIAMTCVLVSRIKKVSIIGSFLIVILVAVPFFEVNDFRLSRPVSIDISRVANEAKNQRLETLNSLKVFLPRNCQIFQVPIYPYPEFDRPDDAVGDYASILIPGEDPGYFKWSNPAIKNSHEWKSIQPLVSENPNFARVSPSYSIDYAAALGACAVMVDRAMLTEIEKINFESIKVDSRCKKDLAGEKFNNLSRFQAIKLRGDTCRPFVKKETRDYADSNSSGKFLWKIDQAYGVDFIDGVQIFPVSSAINSRVSQGLSYNPKDTYKWVVIFYDESLNKVTDSQFKVCKLYINKISKKCYRNEYNQQGQFEITASRDEISKGLMKFEFTLERQEQTFSKVLYWGLTLIQE